MPEQALRLRLRSRIDNIIRKAGPDFPVVVASAAAPGTGGLFVFTAPAACKVTHITYVADTNGAGSSKVYVRKHVAGQTAAANASTSGSNIVDLVNGGIAADSTVRAPVTATLVTTSGYCSLTAGAKLAVVPPANWIGCLTIWMAWV